MTEEDTFQACVEAIWRGMDRTPPHGIDLDIAVAGLRRALKAGAAVPRGPLLPRHK